MRDMRKSQKGFSLIELLIVVAIILIIAAIAIPNLLRSKMAANEASAVGSIRTTITASITYSSTYGNQFPPTLATLGPPAGGGTVVSCAAAGLLDPLLSGVNPASATPQKSGYKFTYTPTGAATAPVPAGCTAGSAGFVIAAKAITQGTTGNRSFCSDETGVLYDDPTGATLATTEAVCEALTPLQ
jgi:type IV pilus assembly protein PilA